MDEMILHKLTEKAQIGKAYVIEDHDGPLMCVGELDKTNFVGWKIFIDSRCNMHMIRPDVMIDELQGDYELVIRPVTKAVESSPQNILDIAATLRDGVVSLNTNVKAALDGVLERSVMTEERIQKILTIRSRCEDLREGIAVWKRKADMPARELKDSEKCVTDWKEFCGRMATHFEQKLAEKELEFRNS